MSELKINEVMDAILVKVERFYIRMEASIELVIISYFLLK
jgi:hypothetical protein